jgi:8-oxo-dGTP diphosphatase
MKKVTAAVLERGGKILIAKRRKGDYLEDKWEFPGGKLEPMETPEECLRRELLEEFGVDTEVGDFICSSSYEYSHISIELLAYKVTYLSGEFLLNSHAEITWIDPAEFPHYDFAEADKPIVSTLLGETIL